MLEKSFCEGQDTFNTDNGVDVNEGKVCNTDGPAPAKRARLDINVQKILPELKTYWEHVDKDPEDFLSWTRLVNYVDKGVRTQYLQTNFTRYKHVDYSSCFFCVQTLHFIEIFF